MILTQIRLTNSNMTAKLYTSEVFMRKRYLMDKKTPEEIAERALQLALYRMAYARRHDIPEEQISVCLYYVAENVTLRPEVLTSDELIALWNSVLENLETV